MEVLFGSKATDGYCIGKAFVIPEPVKRVFSPAKIKKTDADFGWQKFLTAKDVVHIDITQKLSKLPNTKSNEIQREIFEAYLLMLDDVFFIGEIKEFYEKNLFNIEYTLNVKTQEYASKLKDSGNDYLAQRAQDIIDIFGHVQDEMQGIKQFEMNTVPQGSVILAYTLTPSQTIILSKKKISGLVLTEGGSASHVVILARNYGIPCIVGINHAQIVDKVKNGETVVVDAEKGELVVSPDEKTVKTYKNLIKTQEKEQEIFKNFSHKPALTKDGELFNIYANIGSVEEAEVAIKAGADGIGLFRTEFLYMAKAEDTPNAAVHLYNEKYQFEIYKQVLEMVKGKPVTIRTFDAGGDKIISAVDVPTFSEKNPLMGMRAIRLGLAYPKILKTQLRALFRASAFGNLKIMLPLITSVKQVEETLKIVDEVKNELKAEKIDFKENVPIGVMIETAAAALISDCLAKVSDFFSLGTNDLIQYTLGIDRENSNVSDLYDEFNLAVLRLISMTINNAKKQNISLSVCGEMASRQDSILVLGGLGVRDLSMSPKLIAKVKYMLSQFTIPEMQAISSERLHEI